jgi:hypothetical protein
MNCEQESIVYVFIPRSFPQSEILFSFLLSFGSSKSSSSSGNTELEELECSQCGKRFKNARGQTTHFHQVHKLELYERDRLDSKVCRYCEPHRRFNSQSAYNNHQIAKHLAYNDEVEGQAISYPSHSQGYKKCDICLLDITSQDEEVLHVRLLEPRIQWHNCSSCGKIFSNQRPCRQHYNFCAKFC